MKQETILIKFGGSVEKDKAVRAKVCGDIAKLHHMGYSIVVVHGGGKEIDEWLNKAAVESAFYNGLRITDQKTMEIVEMVLCGKVNKDIASLLNAKGVKAIGLSGKDDGMIEAEKMAPYAWGDITVDYGFVGSIQHIRTDLLQLLLAHQYMPVLAPIAKAKDGSSLNINADYAAAHIAAKLEVDRFILLTDVDGIYKNYDTCKRTLLNHIKASEVQHLIKTQEISGGMIPKIECCVEALQKGVKKVSIVNGKQESILMDIVLNDCIEGTTMVI